MEEVDLVNVLNRTSHPPVLPLKKITEFKMATILCNNQQLIRLINECEERVNNETRIGDQFINFKATANEQLSKLNIGMYKERILDWIWPVFFRMLDWKTWYVPRIPFIRRFYWTADCRIDNEKTARDIIVNGMVSIVTQFSLASIFCLVDEINKLWESMGGFNLQKYLRVDIYSFWIRTLRDGDYSPEEHMNELLINAIQFRSIEAVKHLFSIIPEHLKNEKATTCFNVIKRKLRRISVITENDCRIGYFLISQMTLENQYQYFESSLETVLLLLLYSSNEDEFLKVFNYLLINEDCPCVISLLLDHVFWKRYTELFRDIDYRVLFVSAWQNLPDNFKTTIKETLMGVQNFCALIRRDFQFALQINPFTNIELLIGSNLKNWSISETYLSVKEDKWKLLHFLIEEEIVTIKKFKEAGYWVKNIFPERTQRDACKCLIRFVTVKSKARKKK